MKSKLIIVAILTIVTYLIFIGLYCFYQGTKSHPDARQAEIYVQQLIDNKYDSVSNEILISERTAIKIADQIFSEKYGNLHTLLWKPFDIYLINSYWFVYGPVSKSKLDGGPMIIINYHTGETRFKL
ncbi:MAG: NTF2 fold immunity protein [Bacteroidales bacterium]